MASVEVEAKQRARTGEAYLFLCFTMLCWAGNAIAGRYAVGEISPMVLVSLRWLLVVLLLALFARRQIARDWRALRARWRFVFAMGALGFTAFNALFYQAAHTTTAINIGILQGAIPIFVLAGAFLFQGQRVTGLQVAGMAVTLVGVILVATAGDLTHLFQLHFVPGDLLMVAACAFYAGYTIALKRKPTVSFLGFFSGVALAAFLSSLPLLGLEAWAGELLWPTRDRLGGAGLCRALPLLRLAALVHARRAADRRRARRHLHQPRAGLRLDHGRGDPERALPALPPGRPRPGPGRHRTGRTGQARQLSLRLAHRSVLVNSFQNHGGGGSAMPESGARDASALVRQAMTLHSARRLREALQCYQQALLQAPEHGPALTLSAAVLLALGRPKDAIARLQAVLAREPRNAEALGYMGNAYKLTGQPAEAERCFRQAIALSPDDPRLRNNLGVVLSDAKRWPEAAESFEAALTLNPRYAEGAGNLSQVCLKLGQGERAIVAAEHATACAPRAAEHHTSLGNALAESGRCHEALAAYRRALGLRPASVEALNKLAVALVAAGEPAEALETTRRCTAVDPGNVTALATRSVALNELGQAAERAALVDMDPLLQRFAIDPGAGFNSLAAFNGALAQHVAGHPTLRFAPADHATRGGQHSGDLLREPRGPIAALQQRIAEAAQRYLAALPAGFAHPFLDRRPQSWELDIWAVVMQRQGHQVPHIHPSGWLSGVYYVRVDEAVTDRNQEGWIEFGRPQSIYRAKAEPQVRLVRPVEGEMLLFPSFFFHRTIAFDAPAERICIAFDLCPPGQRGYTA